jgi:class 3 adenylate cyclase/pimeloyl-ACP methyl ester carboxylesterase
MWPVLVPWAAFERLGTDHSGMLGHGDLPGYGKAARNRASSEHKNRQKVRPRRSAVSRRQHLLVVVVARADHVAVKIPDPRYVRTDDGVYLAYQVVGDGPVDIAWGHDQNLDSCWESPYVSAWLGRLASFGRLVLHDRRATGLSSRNVDPPNLETRAADLRTVLDAAGSRSTVVGGWFETAAPGVLLAATDPDRVRGLVWWNPSPRTTWSHDYPWGWGPREVEAELAALEHWGTIEWGEAWADQFAEVAGPRPPEEEIRAEAKASRNTCTPDVAVALSRMWFETDLRSVLPSLRVPCLLLVDSPDPRHLAVAEHAAALIPDAQIVLVPNDWPTPETMNAVLGPPQEAIRRFVGLEPGRQSLDSVLASILFTDIVGSTERQAAIGDLDWKDLVERHHALVRGALAQWRGVENDTAGDGFYATFDGPARAIRCALEIGERVRGLGIEVRAGVHTGECEVIDGKVGGIAVSIGARISNFAEPSQVLVSQTVKDLVAGSGLSFTDAGEHELRGVPDRWHLYSVTG